MLPIAPVIRPWNGSSSTLGLPPFQKSTIVSFIYSHWIKKGVLTCVQFIRHRSFIGLTECSFFWIIHFYTDAVSFRGIEWFLLKRFYRCFSPARRHFRLMLVACFYPSLSERGSRILKSLPPLSPLPLNDSYFSYHTLECGSGWPRGPLPLPHPWSHR